VLTPQSVSCFEVLLSFNEFYQDASVETARLIDTDFEKIKTNNSQISNMEPRCVAYIEIFYM